MKRENIVKAKSFEFAILAVQVVRGIQGKQKEFVLSNQLLRSGTSVGANICEAENAESKKDFIHKMSVALKEANETKYWLELMEKSELMDQQIYFELDNKITEITKILISAIKTAKANLNIKRP
ncbi:MAG: four helix bundle protein [Flavobacteriaceae bacterium]